MTVILFGIFLITVALIVGLVGRAGERSRRDRLRRELIEADRKVAREHGTAKRAMNDAAGQSWRNLAG